MMKNLALFFISSFVFGYAQVRWSLDGVRISVASSNQQNAQCVSDMNYGAIVAWEDNRYNSMAYDIFAQRVDSSGNLLWTPSGVPVCVDVLYSQENIVMCSDEVGGTIIVWQDYRNPTGPDLYAQRIDSNGNCLWQSNGVPVCTAPGIQQRQKLALDGNNGVIIIWVDDRPPNTPGWRDIFGQRVDASGNIRWENNGAPICTTLCAAFYPDLIKDNHGGAFLVWDDGGDTLSENLYFQRIDSMGNCFFPGKGKRFFNDSASQYFPTLVRSTQNTIIVAWADYRDMQTAADIYALRFDTLGNPLWDSTGVPVCAADSSQELGPWTSALSDGLGAAIICWRDRRNGNRDVYTQKIDINGSQLWGTNGVPVCTLSTGPHWERPSIGDDSSGVIHKWGDERNGFEEEYLQRIGAEGLPRWAANGVRACTVSATRSGPGFCTDGKGGAITVWTDSRYGSSDLDIWGQRVNDGHAPGVTENEASSVNIDFSLQIFPNPFTRTTRIRYSILDTGYLIQNPTINIYDATGCLVRSFNPESSIQNQESAVSWDGRDTSSKELPAGVYFCRFSIADKTIVKKVVLLKEE